MIVQELIRSLPVSRQDKVNLALVYLGEKPACEIGNTGFFIGHVYNTKPQINRNETLYFELPDGYVENIENVLSKIGLEYDRKGPFFSTQFSGISALDECVDFYVSNNMRTANEIKELFDQKSPLDHYTIGIALGFSKRNVEYWAKRRVIDRDTPDVKLTSEQERKLRFLSFVVERKDEKAVKEALKIAERYAKAIEKFDYDFYTEIMEQSF